MNSKQIFLIGKNNFIKTKLSSGNSHEISQIITNGKLSTYGSNL